MINLKTTLAGAALLMMTALPIQAETVPTVIDVADVGQHFATLSAKAEPTAGELRELAILTFINAADAPELSKKELRAHKKALETLAKTSGNDPEIVAIGAVFYGIQAREAKSDMDALILAKKGITVLDKLVEENPENGGVLMQRGLSALYAPSFLGRDKVFVADFTELLSDRFSLPPAERAYVLYNLLQGYKKIDDKDAGDAVRAELQTLKVVPWTDLAVNVSF